ncbi:MAG: SDR family NAD(P)-dependent oxidoreductase [Gemmatimonadetes bacterium]|nr:SDR family NAD(P)-dependent oxidoreductase [Gemmatimonadota bacterium]
MRVDGRRIILTGASSGIGLALAEQLAQRGARLVLVARDRRRLENVALGLTDRFPGPSAVYVIPCDLTDAAAVQQMMARAVELLGWVDALINNAGVSIYGGTERASVEDFRSVMGVNFFGALSATMEVLPLMRRRHAGVIVNVASVAALHGVPYLAAYSASKAALAALAQSLRAELRDTGIRLTTVYPGYTRTPLFDREKKLGGARRPSGGYVTADVVARRIVTAMEKEEEEVVLSASGRALFALRGVVPRLVCRFMVAIAAHLHTSEQVAHA